MTNNIHSVTILSMNVQGLGDKNKRKDTLNFLKSKNKSIYFLQDTHFTNKEMKYIRSQWGYECFFSNFSSQARGVAIFLNNNFEYKIHRQKADNNGNKLILDMSIWDKKITLINIYGPNRDCPEFYREIKTDIESRDNTCILAGDWNLVLEPQIDSCEYININNPRSRDIVLEMITDLQLVDCWRDQNLEKRQYTWFKKHTNKKARLDFFLISELLMTELNTTNIMPGYRTDHSITTIKLDFGRFEKGRSYWKMNNSLLKDKTYVQEIKNILEKVKRQYSKPEQLVNVPDINSISNKDLKFNISDQLFFEVLLMEIRGKTIAYASHLKKKTNQREKELLTEIDKLEQEKYHKHELIEAKRKELYEIREKKLEGAKIRARAKWIEEGEKPTNYFCNLESRNYISKTMTTLISESNIQINSQKEILNEAKNFYNKLYAPQITKQVNLQQLLKDYDIPKLDDDVKKSLEGEITYDEMLYSLKNMSNNKSPGPDGFTTEFYKFFWNDLGFFLIRAINEGYKNGELSITQRQGVITCIPKGNKDKLYLKNWRPISLLNTSYKIASASIALRLKNTLPTIINDDQTGFLRGRYIGENIRLIYDLMFYLEKNHKPGMLLLIDFEKAFDSVDWGFILKVMKYFNFGPSFIKWIQTFYNKIESCVSINGHLSDWFTLSRGCRQGDPLSPYIFILCAEILAVLIRNDSNIKGITIGSREHKLSQYADDTSILLDGSKTSLENTIKVLKFYAEISGLKINLDKTKVIWIGANKQSPVRFCPDYGLSWDDKFTLLGIKFSVNLTDMIKMNYEEKIKNIKQLLNIWSKRILTPIGKITVIKSLAISKINHLFLSLPNPDDKIIKQLQQTFYKFVWNDKPDKIKRKQLNQNHIHGGLRMLDLDHFIKSLKLTWIRRLLGGEKNYLNILNESHPELKRLNEFGIDFISKLLKSIDNPFWKDVLESYKNFNTKLVPLTKKEFYLIPIWYNPNIKIGGSSICKISWIAKKIVLIKDLLTENESFLSLQDFKIKYNVNTNFIEYEGLIKSIKKYLDKLIFQRDYKDITSDSQLALSIILSNAKGCRTIYDRFITIDKHPPVVRKWIDTLSITTNMYWKKIFKMPFKITKDPQLQWLQFRINNRILGTNYLRKKMKMVSSDLCTFCKTQAETIQHLFYECNTVQHFWTNLALYMTEKRAEIQTDWNITDILFGNKKFDKALNKILLMAKQFIFNQKLKDKQPLLINFKTYLLFHYKSEKYIAQKNLELEKFNKDWNIYKHIIPLM